MAKIEAAKAFAKIAHAGQKYGDQDYFEAHVLEVAKRVESDKKATYGALEAAYLHDVVEDTVATLDDLKVMGFASVDIIEALTRREGEQYFDFIKRLSYSPSAALVKKHDIAANLAAKPSDSLVKRYKKALAILGA